MKEKLKKILTILFVIGCVAVVYLSLDSIFLNSKVDAAWYDTGGTWANRKSIVVDHNKVAGTLYDFPMLVSVIDPDLRHTDHGGKVGNVDGTDILFTDADGTTKLDHEIEKYASTTGELIAWVKITTLPHTFDAQLYMYFGNSGASDQQNVAGVWGGDYLGVWHLDEGDDTSADFYKDSTSSGFDATLVDADGDTTTDTKIDGALALTGDADYLNLGSQALGYTEFAFSAWIKYNDDGACTTTYEGIMSKNSFNDIIIAIDCDSTGEGTFVVYAVNTSATGSGNKFSTGNINDGQWHHFYLTKDFSDFRFYIDGNLDSTHGFNGYIRDSNVQTTFGAYNNTIRQYLNGSLDNIAIHNSARSADWIKTEYNNQSSPNTFYSYGSLQAENKVNANVKVRGGSGGTPGTVKVRAGSGVASSPSISLTNKENNVSTSFPTTSGSLTWTAGARGIVAVAIACPGGGSPNAGELDVTGGSVTWSEMGYSNYGGRRGIVAFLSSDTPGDGTLSINYGGPGENCNGAGTPQEIQYSIDQITGFNTSDVDDPAQVAGFTSGTSLNLPDLGTIDSGDLVYAAFGMENASDNLQPATGLTQHVKRETGGNVRSFLVGYSSTDDTPGITWNSSGGNGGIGFIINIGSGGGSGSPGSVKFR